jgi:type 2 lantibiotic biosynthesis protein LanM
MSDRTTACVLDDPRWWTATPPAERPPGGRPAPDGRARGAARAQAWRTGLMVPGVPVAMSADEEVLASEEPAALRARMPSPPGWLREIHEAWQPCRGTAPALTCFCDGDRRAGQGLTGDAAYLGWIRPLVESARRGLRERVAALAPMLGPEPALLRADHAHLVGMIKRVLVLELHVARRRGLLCGTTSAGRFTCFARGLRRPTVALDLLARYPVLARELVGHLRQWADARHELYQRLRRDLPDIVATFGLDDRPGRDVRDLEFDVSDPHRGGRGVVLVHLACGTVVYKPRPVGPERHFAELVSWVNAQGLAPALRGLAVLDRGDYGWCSFARHEPCPDGPALASFYRRQGAHAALLHAVRAYDAHLFNVVAAGVHPVLVDLETVFRPHAGAVEDGGAVGRALRESVLATLLPPQPTGAPDLSGLTGGGEPRPHARAAVAFAGEDTDEVHVVRRPETLPPSRNRPGGPVDVEAVVAGFRDCYRLLLDRREDLLADRGPIAAFAADRVRVVVRDTATYRTLLAESWHPDLLRDGLDRDRYLSILGTRGAVDPAVARSEKCQLARRDVPVFDIEVAGTTLYDPDGAVRPGFVARSGLASVHRRLRELSEEDMAVQEWYLRASLAGVPRRDDPPVRFPVAAGGDDVLADAAIRIAERLRVTALPSDEGSGPEWPSLVRDGDRWTIEPLGLGLGDGVIGVLVFLAELEAALGETRYRPLADDLLADLLDPAAVPDPEDLAELSTGVYDDLGAMLYLVTRLHELRGDPALLDARAWLLPAIEHNLATTAANDVRTGLSGTALALLRAGNAAMAHPVGPRIAAAAAQERRLGFAAGLSGYAHTLAALGRATGDAELCRAARTALNRERPLLRPGAPGCWAGGLAGALLARSAVLEGPVDPEWEHELRTDVDLIVAALRDHEDSDDSLGHGRLGTAQALRHAAEIAEDEELADLAHRTAVDVAARALDGRARTALPGGIHSPGLLAGSTGIGYGLLEAAAPVPSLLLIGIPPRDDREGDR